VEPASRRVWQLQKANEAGHCARSNNRVNVRVDLNAQYLAQPPRGGLHVLWRLRALQQQNDGPDVRGVEKQGLGEEAGEDHGGVVRSKGGGVHREVCISPVHFAGEDAVAFL
jgi:hypothetical protein